MIQPSNSLQVVFESTSRAHEYASVPSTLTGGGSSPVLPDTTLLADRILVLRPSSLTSLPVTDCSIHFTCESCLGAKDPYCGWCSLESKCSLRTECVASMVVTGLCVGRESIDFFSRRHLDVTPYFVHAQKSIQFFTTMGKDKSGIVLNIVMLSFEEGGS